MASLAAWRQWGCRAYACGGLAAWGIGCRLRPKRRRHPLCFPTWTVAIYPPPCLQYKPHNQTQHSDKGHKSGHHGHGHSHKGNKPHHGGKAANGGVAHKSGKPPAAAHVHVQTDAPAAAAANGEPAAAASS